jgi:hypothetical protein
MQGREQMPPADSGAVMIVCWSAQLLDGMLLMWAAWSCCCRSTAEVGLS